MRSIDVVWNGILNRVDQLTLSSTAIWEIKEREEDKRKFWSSDSFSFIVRLHSPGFMTHILRKYL